MPSRSDKLLAALNQTSTEPNESQNRPRRSLRPETLYPYSEQVDLPLEAAELPDDVQDIARQFISAKRRIGRELLEAARLVVEAKERTEHGQWLLFLHITNTSSDVGEYLQNIWRRASAHTAFREAIERGWLSEGVARRMARDSVPDDAINAILQLSEPNSQTGRAEVARSATSIAIAQLLKYRRSSIGANTDTCRYFF